MKEPLYNLARPVVCRRDRACYDAEVQVPWLKTQWVIERGCSTHEGAELIAQVVVNSLHDRLEEYIMNEMQRYSKAAE